MDGVRDYHAKRNKPNPKNKRPNVFSDMWKLIHKKGGWIGKNRVTLYEVEGSEGRGRGMGEGMIVE